jgi:hypothetical protein
MLTMAAGGEFRVIFFLNFCLKKKHQMDPNGSKEEKSKPKSQTQNRAWTRAWTPSGAATPPPR